MMLTNPQWRLAFVTCAALVLAGPSAQSQSGPAARLKARLQGLQEVPAVSTTARGDFSGVVNSDGTEVAFKLSYDHLEGVVQVAHIHFGQPNVNGGVMVFLCGGGGKPACPPSPATVEGTFTGADVVGPAGQGITTGEFTEVLRAIGGGNSYANVHSDKFPGGEMRGQISVDIN